MERISKSVQLNLNYFISLLYILNGCIVAPNYLIRYGVKMCMLKNVQLMYIFDALEKRSNLLDLINLYKLYGVLVTVSPLDSKSNFIYRV